MKKIILSIVLVCFCIVAHAAHLKFMGIPITGTITAFQSKLQTKGCKISKDNILLPSGIRKFKGVLRGKIVRYWYGITIGLSMYIGFVL